MLTLQVIIAVIERIIRILDSSFKPHCLEQLPYIPDQLLPYFCDKRVITYIYNFPHDEFIQAVSV
ncbi:hypothetical protein D3C76_1430550 [compost metagenome]